MTVKEMIEAEIDSMGSADLEELYEIIRRFARERQASRKQTLIAQLKSIEIDALEDFAANHDRYVQGQESG